MEADALGECEVRRVQDKGGPGTAFLPLFTWHQPFHLHDWGEGPQPSETLGVPMFLPSVRRGKATSLFPVGPGCPQSPPEPPECQVQGAPWSCAHVGTAGSLGSASCLPQVWALPLRCASQGLRKMGSAWCAQPRGGSRSPRCSGETSAERSSWRSPRPTPRMLKGCSAWRRRWW